MSDIFNHSLDAADSREDDSRVRRASIYDFTEKEVAEECSIRLRKLINQSNGERRGSYERD